MNQLLIGCERAVHQALGVYVDTLKQAKPRGKRARELHAAELLPRQASKERASLRTTHFSGRHEEEAPRTAHNMRAGGGQQRRGTKRICVIDEDSDED